MNDIEMRDRVSKTTLGAYDTPLKLEVVAIPVADIERAKAFYTSLDWRLDADFTLSSEYRVIQFTPPGSSCSIHFGRGITCARPGSAQGLYLVVFDIEAARTGLIGRGVKVSEPYHKVAGAHVDGPDPERRSYGSYASFQDPDGNGWLLQEVTTRLPGRVDSDGAYFVSQMELSAALRRAADAHEEHEKQLGRPDPNWPDWYAQYLLGEQYGRSATR
jgi:catechol 2,3-dioxygenase-like lactoylglutathione lyase family enzyme